MSTVIRRIIGTYSQPETPINTQHPDGDALVLVVAATHGNEGAGVRAMQTVLRLLEEEKAKHPEFTFRGKLIGLVGNTTAYAKKLRYLDTDLNRIWNAETVARVCTAATPKALPLAEEREMRELITTIEQEIAAYTPTRIYLLDLHTTTAEGGIFSIVTASEESRRIAQTLFAPMITGFDRIIEGTMMQYLDGNEGISKGAPLAALTFEAGQHDDPESVTNAVSAIINVLRAVGCVHPDDVEDKHDERLRARAAELPARAELVYRHAIRIGDSFKMREGYLNFQPVQAKEVVAHDRKGAVRAPSDALMLMPLYQALGDDGFFLIKPV